MIAMIVAMGENHVIGKDNQMPWHLPNDLKWFKQVTGGHSIVMGRKTFESIGKPLPNRQNIILTRQSDYQPAGTTTVSSIKEALQLAQEEDLFVIGGANVYQQFLPYADRLYITKIHETFEGDAYFPDFDQKDWKMIKKRAGQMDEKNKFAHDFYIYQREND